MTNPELILLIEKQIEGYEVYRSKATTNGGLYHHHDGMVDGLTFSLHYLKQIEKEGK